MEASIHLTRKQKKRQMRAQVLEAVEERLLEKLTGAGVRVCVCDCLPPYKTINAHHTRHPHLQAPADTKESFRNMLREGQLENRQIELRVATPSTPVAAFGGPGGNMEAMGFGIEALQNLVGKQRKERKMLTIEEVCTVCVYVHGWPVAYIVWCQQLLPIDFTTSGKAHSGGRGA